MSVAYVYSHESAEPHADAVWGLAWAGADRTLSASSDGVVAVCDAATGAAFHATQAHTAGLTAISASADGTRALACALDGRVTLLDPSSGTVLAAHASTGVRDEVAWTAAIAPDGAAYATSGASGSVHVRSAAPESFGELRATLIPPGEPQFGVAVSYSPDGQRVALGTRAGVVHIFDAGSGTLAATLPAHALPVRSLAWAPDSHLLVSGGEDRRLVLHDVRHARAGAGGAGAVAALVGHAGWVLSADVSPDARLLLSSAADGSARLWDLGARAAVGAVHDGVGSVCAARWRPGATAGAFAAAGEDGVVRWYRAAGGA